MRRVGGLLLAGALSLTSLLACCGVAVGYALRDTAEHSRRYAEQIGVGEGYQRIDHYQGGDGTCRCNIERWYLGPADADPARVFTGPHLTFGPWPGAPINDNLWEWLLRGEGHAEGTGRCLVSVKSYRRGHQPYDMWRLSDDQVAEWNSGRKDILELFVGCDADMGGPA